jgi:hypothetical protein
VAEAAEKTSKEIVRARDLVRQDSGRKAHIVVDKPGHLLVL